MHHAQEIAPHAGILLWRVEGGHSYDEEEVRDTYAWCKEFIEEFTGCEQHFYYDHDHPNIVVMIGGWQSVAQHFSELHKSEDFMEILMAFGGKVDVRASFHVNIAEKSLQQVCKSDALLMNRIWVTDEDEKEFTQRYRNSFLPRSLEGSGREFAVGWKITEGGWSEKDALDYFVQPDASKEAICVKASDKEEELEKLNELVTLVGFDSIEQHEELVKRLGKRDHRELVKHLYTRRFVKMDLSAEDDSEDEE